MEHTVGGLASTHARIYMFLPPHTHTHTITKCSPCIRIMVWRAGWMCPVRWADSVFSECSVNPLCSLTAPCSHLHTSVFADALKTMAMTPCLVCLLRDRSLWAHGWFNGTLHTPLPIPLSTVSRWLEFDCIFQSMDFPFLWHRSRIIGLPEWPLESSNGVSHMWSSVHCRFLMR